MTEVAESHFHSDVSRRGQPDRDGQRGERSDRKQSARDRERSRARFVPGLRDPAVKAQRDGMLADELVKALASYKRGRIVGGVIVIALASLCGLVQFYPASIFFGLLLLGIVFRAKPRLEEMALERADYYTLMGSHDEHGEHRCLDCGHRGIYQSRGYASSHMTAVCSKCRFQLWREFVGKSPNYKG